MRGEWLYLFCRHRVGSSFLFYAIDCGKGPKWERKRGTRLCGGHAPARGDYHLDVRCSRIHYAVMLVSVLCPWCRKAVRSVFRNGAIRAYAMGFALCLLLSGCLFGSGNKQDTLQPMTDEAPNPAKKTIRYSVKLMDGMSPLEIELPGPLNALKKPLLRVVKGTVVEKLLRDHNVIKDGMLD